MSGARAVFAGLLSSALVIVQPGALGAPLPRQAPASQSAAKAERTAWYFYRIKWGFQAEWVDLFQRNHLPVLRAEMKEGRITSVRTFVPTYHGDGRADWTFAVELVEPANAPPVDEEALIKKLYPDQGKYEREEKRRFEILVAHWDVPLNVIDLGKRGDGK